MFDSRPSLPACCAASPVAASPRARRRRWPMRPAVAFLLAWVVGLQGLLGPYAGTLAAADRLFWGDAFCAPGSAALPGGQPKRPGHDGCLVACHAGGTAGCCAEPSAVTLTAPRIPRDFALAPAGESVPLARANMAAAARAPPDRRA